MKSLPRTFSPGLRLWRATAIALAALFAMFALSGGDVARAQSVDPLVSNLDRSTNGQGDMADYDLAQRFYAHDGASNYYIASVDIPLRGETAISGIEPGSANSPLSPCAPGPPRGRWSQPSRRRRSAAGPGTTPLHPPARVALSNRTTYWLVSDGGTADWRITQETGEDTGTNPSWSISDNMELRPARSTGGFAVNDINNEFGSNVLKFRLNGILTSSVTTNAAASGAPAIVAPNVFRLPATLSVDLSGITDSNGVSRIADSASYKWQRFASNGTTLLRDNIGTEPTYTLTHRDVGDRIKVVVSFVDDQMTSEGPLTSAATDVITAAAACGGPRLEGGARLQGQPLRVEVEKFGTAPYVYGYSHIHLTGEITNIFGLPHYRFRTAAGNTYTIVQLLTAPWGFDVELDRQLANADVNSLGIQVCGGQIYPFRSAFQSNESYSFTGAGEDWSGHAVRNVRFLQDSTSPRIYDADTRGSTLEVRFSETLAPASNLSTSSFEVKKTPQGASEVTVSLTGAPSISDSTVTLRIASSSTIVSSDGNVRVKYIKPGTGSNNKIADRFGNETATTGFKTVRNFSSSSSQQQVVENTPAEGAPAITGTAEVGRTLTADTAGITDANGLQNAAFTYQWLADDAEISGATGSTYLVDSGDVGKAIKVRVDFTTTRATRSR